MTRTKILTTAKEVFETGDMDEVALRLQSGEWVAIGAAYKPELVLVLMKI